MQMLRVENIFQVEIGDAVFRHGARIRQDVAFLSLRQNHSEPGNFSIELANASQVDFCLRQTLDADWAERIAADAGAEIYGAAEAREIVREDCGRTAERQTQICCEVFAVELQFLRQAVKNKIEVQLADHADVKFGHHGSYRSLLRFYAFS